MDMCVYVRVVKIWTFSKDEYIRARVVNAVDVVTKAIFRETNVFSCMRAE